MIGGAYISLAVSSWSIGERSRATRKKRSREIKNEERIARRMKKNGQERDRIALERSERVYERYR